MSDYEGQSASEARAVDYGGANADAASDSYMHATEEDAGLPKEKKPKSVYKKKKLRALFRYRDVPDNSTLANKLLSVRAPVRKGVARSVTGIAETTAHKPERAAVNELRDALAPFLAEFESELPIKVDINTALSIGTHPKKASTVASQARSTFSTARASRTSLARPSVYR